MTDLLPTVVAGMAFISVVVFALLLIERYRTYTRIQNRLPQPFGTDASEAGGPTNRIVRFFETRLGERRVGMDRNSRNTLRLKLQRAGYFSGDAVSAYVLWRITTVVGCFILSVSCFWAFPASVPWSFRAVFVVVLMFVGVYGPDAFISRRERRLVQKFRLEFPEFLDLLVVCVDAGLTIEPAFAKVGSAVAARGRVLSPNLAVLAAEMRAGRSMVEALNALSDRVGLEEARALVSMIRQSIELGSDLAGALRVFSDEIRDRRLLRAEEAANKLSVKLVLPLGIFIFPVIVLVIMLPVVIKLSVVLH